MANKADTGNLQRGKACLRCRKRKMRCDGSKPACQQCTRAKKGDSCEYDDGKSKTRTQLLRETIARLEHRIHELEEPGCASHPVELFTPPMFHRHSESSSSSMSSLGSPGSASLSASQSPFPESTHSRQGSWSQAPPSSPPTPFVTDMFFEDPLSFDDSLFELGPILLDIFAPHRHQCGLEIHLGRLRESLNHPISEQRHPALMNAIYLWACFVSRPEPLCQHEEHFLNQALEAHREGLRRGDNLVDIIRASCILSMYFLANGRLLEGSYHSSAAAALAVQSGLHAGVSNNAMSWPHENHDEKPAKLDYREGERILAFWQVYNLDRCWSVALRKPSIIPDDSMPWNSIHCPWPQDIAEYEAGHVNASGNYETIRSFLEGEVSIGGFSTHALRAKASVLFAKADKLSSSWDSRMKPSDHLQAEVRALELTILRFISTLLPLGQLDGAALEDKHVLIVTHSLAHAAIIHLHQRFAQDDSIAYDKCSQAASACVSVIKHTGDMDFDFLDPIIGPCWTSASDILIRDLNSLETSWPLLPCDDIKGELSTILYAMTSLSTKFPILSLSASKIQSRLS